MAMQCVRKAEKLPAHRPGASPALSPQRGTQHADLCSLAKDTALHTEGLQRFLTTKIAPLCVTACCPKLLPPAQQLSLVAGCLYNVLHHLQRQGKHYLKIRWC